MALTIASWLGLAVVMILAAEMSFRLSMRLRPRRPRADDGDEGSGYVLSAALALLGLLVAFVFGMAAERYEGRRLLVVDEANAISTAALRYQLLPEPNRSELIRTMSGYVKVRLAFFDAGRDKTKVKAAEAEAEAVQGRLWEQIGRAIRTPEGAPLVVPVLTATNEMFDLAAARHAALDARVPPRALQVLVLFAVAAAALMGHSLAADGRRHFVSTSGLFVLVALAISLIVDLDSPRAGRVLVPQGPMIHAAEQVEAMAARLDAPPPPSP
ncbi:hypothetical protein LJR164_004215 [Phenylobacterium sp. LjRoot164]|uniref:bestrophin-like domain n=1 Tax=unclassified Phenylobacterium TaxID=2640670 RepID=UPI003ECEAF0A